MIAKPANMKSKHASTIVAAPIVFCCLVHAQPPKMTGPKISIDVSSPGTKISFPLYGISGEKETNENTFDRPLKITPKQEQYNSFASQFEMEFKPYPLTVLRIKKQ
jgi:alpha-L-arabinofuranosidase